MARGIVRGGLNDGGSNIKSIQRGSVNVNATTVNVAISSVDPTKAIVMLAVAGRSSGNSNYNLVSGAITSPTNIAFYIGASGSSTTVDWVVIEFNNVKSFQSGNKVTTLATDSVTISNVNMEKSILFYSFSSSDSSATFSNATVSVSLSTGTNIAISQFNAVNKSIQWQVIEFN